MIESKNLTNNTSSHIQLQLVKMVELNESRYMV